MVLGQLSLLPQSGIRQELPLQPQVHKSLQRCATPKIYHHVPLNNVNSLQVELRDLSKPAGKGQFYQQLLGEVLEDT